MRRITPLFLLGLVFTLTLFVGGCSSDNPGLIIPTPPVVPIEAGFNFSPQAPNADQPLTITFKANNASGLYGYTGDVYLHTGVVSQGVWMYVPAEWSANTTKCKMTLTESNVWSITLSPSIRQWFGSGTTAIEKLGIVVRSADGTKKGSDTDQFATVSDDKYTPFAPAAIKHAALPSGVLEGVNVVDNTTVTLVLYDKDTAGNHKDFAHVVGDFNSWTLSNESNSQMNRDEAAGCWWITLKQLNATKEYAFQYYVGIKNGETVRIADAYCRKILDPDNDKSISPSTYPDNKEYPVGGIGIVSVFKIQQDEYNWRVTNFKKPSSDELVIYELLLRDFSSMGNLSEAMDKLAYLKSLGVNAIELMPVQEFDGNDSWGYNPCFFFALDKAYGTDRMYKEFVDRCHELGMAVIFDVVYNHATGSHPFAKLYWNGAKNLTASNNPWFNVNAPHPYSVFHDFNHESPLVRAFVKRNLAFLLTEYNIDGFRFDLTKGFTQKASNESTASNYDATRIAILKEYSSAVKAASADAYVILEHFCATTEEKELANAGMMLWRNVNNAYCQSAMGYPEGSDFSGLYYGTTMPANSLVGFMESHDEERMGYKQTAYSTGALKTSVPTRMRQLAANAAFSLTVPGPKMVWQFGEMGYDVSIEENGRTGKKPLHWEYLDNTDRKALHDTYAQLIQLRTTYPELFKQGATFAWKVGVSDWTKGRSLSIESVNGKRLVIVGNFTSTAIEYTASFSEVGEWHELDGTTFAVTSNSQVITVPANHFKLYKNFN